MSASVIGVDLGGTNVLCARLHDGELHQTMSQPTDLSGGAALLNQLVEMVQDAQGKGDAIDAVGIGVPSVVDFETGRVVSSVNVPLADVPLRKVLQERLGVPVFVDNDATVAALAEAYDENLRPVVRNLVMITVGTGIGGGLVLGGRIYRGATGAAGEIGHTLIGLDLGDDVPEPVEFPQPGSFEWFASGHALDRLATERAAEAPASVLGRQLARGAPILGRDVDRAALAGDAVALTIARTWAGRLGIGVANAINTFDPDEVVIGGGAARAGELLLVPVRRVALGYVLPGLGTRTQIRLARHGVRAGVLGAALLAVHELEDAGGGSADRHDGRPDRRTHAEDEVTS